jgi:hypothetical protein
MDGDEGMRRYARKVTGNGRLGRLGFAGSFEVFLWTVNL